MKFNVSQDCIDRGVCENPKLCMVAQAVIDQIGPKYGLSRVEFYPKEEQSSIFLSKRQPHKKSECIGAVKINAGQYNKVARTARQFDEDKSKAKPLSFRGKLVWGGNIQEQYNQKMGG